MLTGGNPLDISLPQVQARLASVESRARRYWNSMDKDPGAAALWPDLPSTTVSAQITSAYDRLKAMALAWATHGQSLYGNGGSPRQHPLRHGVDGAEPLQRTHGQGVRQLVGLGDRSPPCNWATCSFSSTTG